MTTFGETPAEAERTLTNEEVAQFRNDVLWPSIKWLKRGNDYMREAPIGSRFEIGETVLIGDKKASVWLQAEIFSEYIDVDDDDSYGRVAELEVSTEFIDEHMTQGLIDTARASGVTIDQLDVNQGLVSAWTRNNYLIDDTDDPVCVSSHHILKGLDDEELWSDEMMGKPDALDLSLDYDELKSLEALQDLIEGELTAEHLEYIRFVLSILGVPEDLVYPE